jgi:hypothetical protein
MSEGLLHACMHVYFLLISVLQLEEYVLQDTLNLLVPCTLKSEFTQFQSSSTLKLYYANRNV